jgi:hypothetical protein
MHRFNIKRRRRLRAVRRLPADESDVRSLRREEVMNRGSVVKAALLMSVVSLLLIWLPIVGPIVAGVVGGRAARTVGKALAASVVPSLLLGAGLFAILNAFDLPLIGALSGLAVFLFVLIGDIPMAIAAAAVASVTPDSEE